MKTLTHPQYLQLLGLLALAAEHIAQLTAIERAAETLTGEKAGEEDSHTSNAVWSGESPQRSADYLFKELKITISK